MESTAVTTGQRPARCVMARSTTDATPSRWRCRCTSIQLFTLMFTNSGFVQAFYRKLKYYDVAFPDWEEGEDGAKTRCIRFLLDVMGKTSTTTVTEEQTMSPISRPGSHYVVNSEVSSAGVPMADVFYNTKHYCIRKVSNNKTQLDAWTKTKFRKFTVFKAFLEKTANDGMDDHHSVLKQSLLEWTSGTVLPCAAGGGSAVQQPSAGSGRLLPLVLGLTLLLLALNGYLYVRMARLGRQTEALLHSSLLAAEFNAAPEWMERLSSVQQQEEARQAELARWHQAVQAAAELVRKTESALTQLQGTMDPAKPGSSDIAQSPAVTAPSTRLGT
ncbi:uncharacterized protein LOC119107679 [Pollicipes pollicipes]|uniref:uncharacterized protein LOC119107679 n=1 Tax=Pollicipes pollicipes TaxID=41117 RepID=UPI0018849C58|nr:uncharacterized protein LOC119107679 [Pollicipes pollicipes]